MTNKEFFIKACLNHGELQESQKDYKKNEKGVGYGRKILAISNQFIYELFTILPESDIEDLRTLDLENPQFDHAIKVLQNIKERKERKERKNLIMLLNKSIKI